MPEDTDPEESEPEDAVGIIVDEDTSRGVGAAVNVSCCSERGHAPEHWNSVANDVLTVTPSHDPSPHSMEQDPEPQSMCIS